MRTIGDRLGANFGSNDRVIVSLPFRNRRAAGALLAEALERFRGSDALVFGLARGGVTVADEVSRKLGLPLGVWIARKLGVPGQPELGMGAIAEGAAITLDPGIVQWANVSEAELQRSIRYEAAEIRERAARYRAGNPPRDVGGRIVILVDDGVATGGTMRAAIRGARKRGAARVVAAAPVGAPEAISILVGEADEVVCLATPERFRAVGVWYDDFAQVSDDEVVEMLEAGAHRRPRAA